MSMNENLDERIERIRRQTEEIEEKHRIVEEDRLLALKFNAMVKTKSPKDEDWPKAHKYDKLDFTYDVKIENPDDSKQKLDVEQQQQFNKPKRTFADGEGPPPDPIYNFLADAERDGKEQQKAIEKKDSRSNLSNVKNTDKEPLQIKRNEQHINKNNVRDRNNANGNFNGNNNSKTNNNIRYQKQNSQPEYEQWRSEKTDDNNKLSNRLNKNVNEKWRRDNNDFANKSPKFFTNNKNQVKQSPSKNIVEKRGNIMVSLSPGEVKSVKLTSTQVIGSGRVGPRQISKPQFHIQSMEKNIQEQQIMDNIQSSPQHNYNQQFISQSKNTINQHQQSVTPSIQRQQQQQHQLQQINNQFTTNNVLPKSPTKENRKQQCNPQDQQQQLISSLNKNITIADDVPLTTNPTVIQNIVNQLLNESTSDTLVTNSEVPVTNSVPQNIDLNVLAVAKTLSNKPEFAKKSVQDRLLRIRQTNINNNNSSVSDTDERKPTENIQSIESIAV